MGNINKYSDSEIYKYLNKIFPGDTDRTNYISILCSMGKKQSVEELISIYDVILQKWVGSKFPEDKCISGTWCDHVFQLEYNSYYISLIDINSYISLIDILNQEILRVFEDNVYSDKLALECITNLKDSESADDICNYIISKSSESVQTIAKKILGVKKRIKEARSHMNSQNKETNEYVAYKPNYISDMKFLIKNGLYRSFDIQSYEVASGIVYYCFSDITSMIKYAAILILIIFVLFYFIHL